MFKIYKIILSIFISYFIFTNFQYTTQETINNIENKNVPIIKNVSPEKFEQYIVRTPTIKINYLNENEISNITFLLNYEDVTSDCIISNNSISYTPSKKLKAGNQIVKIIIEDTFKNKICEEWYFTVGIPNFSHYYGLLHSHTINSDGHGTYNDAYFMAKEKSHLDFFAITEHSDLLDNNLNANLSDASMSQKWNDLSQSQKWFNVDDNFIALKGFEMSYRDNLIGHINIFNSEGFLSTNNPHLTLEKFYDIIYENDELIGQFNHPCEKFGDFNNLEYNKKADEIISLIEVYNGYNEDITKNIVALDKYQDALDKGWHVAPTANQDNHRVDFGISNEFRTVILSTKLTQDAIFDALKNMRVYATNDKNIKIDFNINNMPMGSTLHNISKLNFYVSAIDEDTLIDKIEIISNKGIIIKEEKFNSNYAKIEFNIDSIKNRFYYVKIYQENDKISVTAPFWIK